MPGGVMVAGESLEDTGREAGESGSQGKWEPRQGIQHVRNSNISHLAEVREMALWKQPRDAAPLSSLGGRPPYNW